MTKDFYSFVDPSQTEALHQNKEFLLFVIRMQMGLPASGHVHGQFLGKGMFLIVDLFVHIILKSPEDP